MCLCIWITNVSQIITGLNDNIHQGDAKGEAYIDDGKTFEYKNNKFSHQLLNFSNNKLSCR